MLDTLLDATREKPERGVITLIGPPQEGKNHAGFAYAKTRGLPPLVWNVAGDPEEEIGGFPLKSATEVIYSDPPAITSLKRIHKLKPDDPYMLIIDELDKARRDQLTTILSLLNPEQRCIRHYTLPVGSVILCLMNEPVTPLPEPMLARLLIVGWPTSDEARVQALPNTVQFIARSVFKPVNIKFPARPITCGAFFKLEAWFDLPCFWEDEAVRQTVVRGLFPEQATAEVLSKLKEEQPMGDVVKWISVARPQTLVDKLIYILCGCDNTVRNEAMTAFCERAKNDKTGEIQRIWTMLLSTPDAIGMVGMPKEAQELGRLALLKALSNGK